MHRDVLDPPAYPSALLRSKSPQREGCLPERSMKVEGVGMAAP
jgi:hypothetical protein